MNNWRTTIAGFITGAIPIVKALIAAYEAGRFTGETGWGLLEGIGIVVIGALAADSKSNGSIWNTIKGIVGHLPNKPPLPVIVAICMIMCFSVKGQMIAPVFPKPVPNGTAKQCWRISGPTVMAALPDLSLYTGMGLEYANYTYKVKTDTTGRTMKNWGIGLSLMQGGKLVPSNLISVTAVGLHVSLLNGFVTLGLLYGITLRRVQAATGPMSQLFPSN